MAEGSNIVLLFVVICTYFDALMAHTLSYTYLTSGSSFDTIRALLAQY